MSVAARVIAPDPDRSEWERLLAIYREAKAAEDKFDVDSGIADATDLSVIPPATWAEIQRLTDIRGSTEDPLMAHPAPDLEAFAIKFLIAHADDRDANGWNPMLEAEALRLLGSKASA